MLKRNPALLKRNKMPFKSKAQARYLFKEHPEMAKEWASKTPSIKSLPQHVKAKRAATRMKNKLKIKGDLKPGDLLKGASKVERVIANKKGKGNTLAETSFKGTLKNPVAKKIVIYKKSHGKDQKKESNRLINTVVHEEFHRANPKATEKETYKKTNVKNVNALPDSFKKKLLNKYKQK